MNKLNIFVCENFLAEFAQAAKDVGIDDAVIIPFPGMCENKSNRSETKALLKKYDAPGDSGLILCSKHCDANGLVPVGSSYDVKSTNYCINHLANDGVINYIVQKGGYIIGSGWLNHWRKRIGDAGFDRETARSFYRDFCRELVYFDTGIDPEAEHRLRELAAFLELPYVIVPAELEGIQLLLKSAVYEWRLHKSTAMYAKSLSEIQSQCAEYAAILDLIGRISSFTNRRDTIEKIKEIFVMILGAQQFKYWNSEYDNSDLPADIAELLSNHEKAFLFLPKDNRFCLKIQMKNRVYGVIDVRDFLFPQYLEKYFNFALEIVKVSGLVITNIEQYEKLTKSENELRYFSYHDALTGLYNRTYLHEIMISNKDTSHITVFMFDIDMLKYVNDNYGHLEGDKLICSMADVLKKCFRETDTAARIGGDEFAVIVPECDVEMAQIFKQRILDAITASNNNGAALHLQLSASIGFAAAQGTAEPLEKLIQKADERMYEDKSKKHMIIPTGKMLPTS